MNTSKTTLTLTVISVGLIGLLTSCHSKANSDDLASLKSRISSLEQQVAMLNQAIAKEESAPAPATSSEPTGESAAATEGVGTETGDGSQVASNQPLLTSMEVQKALQNAGYYHGTVDGKVGPKTTQAIKDFQTENGLTADGKVGKKTSDRLRAHL